MKGLDALVKLAVSQSKKEKSNYPNDQKGKGYLEHVKNTHDKSFGDPYAQDRYTGGRNIRSSLNKWDEYLLWNDIW